MITRVGRVDPDEVMADGDNLVGGRHAGGSGILSHLAMFALVVGGAHRVPRSGDWAVFAWVARTSSRPPGRLPMGAVRLVRPGRSPGVTTPSEPYMPERGR